MNVSKFLFILFLACVSGQIFGQSKAESLLAKLSVAETDSAKGKLCRRLSLTYYERDNAKAEQYAKKAFTYHQSANNAKGMGLALQMLGYIYLSTGDNDRCIETQKRAIKILEDAGHYAQSVVCYSAASYALEKEGKLTEALELVLKSLEVIEVQKLPDVQKAKNLVDLARIYRINNQLQESINTYEKALRISKKAKDHATSGIVLMNMGNVHRQKGEFGKAVQYFEKSVIETRACKCNGRMSAVWNNLGFAHFALGDTTGLEMAIDSARFYLVDESSIEEAGDIELLLGMRYQLQNKHQKAVVHLEKALEISKKQRFGEKIIQTSTLLETSYAVLGDKKKLQDLLIDALEIKDNSYNAEMAASLAEMQIQYEVEKKERALAAADAENATKEKYIGEIKARNTWLIGLLALFLVLSAFAFHQLRKNRKSSKLIEDKNQDLAKLLGQKNLLLKEIHHRVKNNLQTVSSLLSLQTRASKDSDIKKAIGIGQSRLKSISLLHQKLYQHEELTKIEMDEYMDDLCSYIIKNFNYQDKNINARTNANGIALDLDTAIPIGLILNELITNSIKHSFAEVDDCRIEVSLKAKEELNEFELHVSNNGSGLSKDVKIDSLKSTGLKLVQSLSRQIQGSFKTYEEENAHFVVDFVEAID